MHNPLSKDLDNILNQTEPLWSVLRGERLFVTGGTGFFGKWILESFNWANKRLNLNAKALVLTRNADSFLKVMPHFADNPAVSFHKGDIRNFIYPSGEFSHILHASTTSAVATYNNESPLGKYRTIVIGAERTLEFASHCGCKNFLLTSSGAVYGPQPYDVEKISENYTGAPSVITPIESALGESKRVSELLACIYAADYGFSLKIARCFSFIGPYLQLDIHYAIGNFIRSALAGENIVVNGDGSPMRSYLYASDLMVWLWTIFFNGQHARLYNVGSDKAISISDLAYTVRECVNKSVDVQIMKSPLNSTLHPNRYIPDISRVWDELGLKQTVDLHTSIEKTLSFYRKHTLS